MDSIILSSPQVLIKRVFILIYLQLVGHGLLFHQSSWWKLAS